MRYLDKILKRLIPLFIIFYGILPVSAQTILDITDEIRSDTSLTNTIVNMYGTSELHITDVRNPIPESQINLYSENAWLFFNHIRPSAVINDLMNQIKIFDQDAVLDNNVRVVIYLGGAVVIPHATDYKPLTVYEDSLYGGLSMELDAINYHRESTTLSNMNDMISSFILKRGYMATFAEENFGRGFSKVYVAQDVDIRIEKLPKELNDKVSFIRVMPWNWVSKKGYCGDYMRSPDTLRCTWYYDWGSGTASTSDIEYVPMHWGEYISSINSRDDVTQTLGFNEPDHTDQANLTVDQAIALWPDLLRSGLRLGAPAPSDGGLGWLYNFMDKAEALNYRVDYVPVHYYKGGWTIEQLYGWLKDIHERTARPLWLTEWNNGANWTCCDPTYEEQAQWIADALAMLDTVRFVERYSIYNWVEDTRALIVHPYTIPPVLTQAGEVYRDFQAGMAYYDPGDVPQAPTNLQATAASSIQMDLSWTDNADNEAGFRIERKTGGTAFNQIARLAANMTHYSDLNLVSETEYIYRVTAYNVIGDSRWSNIASDSTSAGISILPHNGWNVIYVDSEELVDEVAPANNAIDGNANTFWHTEWGTGGTALYPHEIQIDLGNSYAIAGLMYLPRQDGNINGTIAGYEIYVSADTSDWGEAVASGTWANNSNQKTANFNAIEGQYIRLIATSEVNGNNWSSVAEIDILVEGSISTIGEQLTENAPKSFALSQNYPNPFNPTTIINYSIPKTRHVVLRIYNMLGKEIATLVNEEQAAGTYSKEFDARQLPSGIYFYTIRAANFSETKKMLLLK